MKRLLLSLLLVFFTTTIQANWQLNNDDSFLSFISIKAYNVGEIHHFKQLEGQVNENGQVELKINLNSIDTKIEVRDQHMKEVLFETDRYPQAILTAQVDFKKINELPMGKMLTEQLEVRLDFHGIPRTLMSNLVISRLTEDTLLVISQFPLLLNAADFNLIAGIDKLLELTKLPRISEAVPVSFVLTFKKIAETTSSKDEKNEKVETPIADQ
jgi:hypothetical protein